jgi:hypothetical protein
MAMTPGLRDFAIVCFCGIIHYIYRNHERRVLPFPPSLPRWPLVGNAFQLPLTHVHLFYQELGRKLGEFIGSLCFNQHSANKTLSTLGSKVVYVETLGNPIIVVNDAGVAKDLLEKRSAIYSSRCDESKPSTWICNFISTFIGLLHL